MKVPHSVVPRTSRPSTPGQYVQVRADPNAFGAGIGRAISGLGARLEVEARKVDEEAKRRAMFDVNMQVADESLYAMQDFEQRSVDAPLGAQGFTQSVLGDYTKRHEGIVERMQAEGAPEEAVQAMQLRLADLRQGLVGKSLTFQEQSYKTKIGADVQKLGLNLSQIAGMAPDEMEGARAELFEAVDALPDLDAIAKQRLKDEYGSAITLAAGYGRATQDPAGVIQRLTGAAPGDYFDVIRRQESSGDDSAANSRSSAFGRYQFLDDTWAGLVKRYPGSGLTPDGRGNPAQEEIAIRLFTKENADALGRAQISPTNANLYAAHFLGAGGAISVLRQPDDVALSQVLPAAVISANPHLSGKTVGWFKNWTSNVTGKAKDRLAPPIDGKTGDPILDALTPTQRAQVLGTARTEFDRRQSAVRGELSRRVDNASAAYLTTGEFAGNAPTQEEFYAAFDPAEAEQRWAAFSNTKAVGEFVQGMKTMTAGEIAAEVQRLLPQDTASPTYATDLQAYERATQAQATVLKARADDPAGYVTGQYPAVRDLWASANTPEDRQTAFAAMEAAYQQLGMLPSQMVPYPRGVLEREVERFAGMTPEQKVSALATMKTEMGGMFQAGLRQFSDKGMKVEAYLAGLVTTAPAGQEVAANVLRGMEMMAKDPSVRPKQGDIDYQFRSQLGAAQRVLNPEATAAMNQAATALYVFNGGDPDVINSTLYDDALRQVLGGKADDFDTGIVDMTGMFSAVEYKTILPPGVNKGQFEDWQEGLGETDFARLGNGAPVYSDGRAVNAADIAADGVFVRVGPTEYRVFMGSDGRPLGTANGEYYSINIPADEVLNALSR